MIKNQIKTVLLLGLLTGVLLGIGSFFGTSGLIIGLIFALVMNLGSYWFSDKIVLKMYKAKQVSENESPNLHRLVSEVADLAELPKPKVYVIPTESVNAFATGRNPKNAAVAVTNGIMKLLNTSELKGVLAHEIAHVKNRDILISTIAAVIAGVITYIAFFARFSAIFGGFGGRDRGNIIGLLFLAIVTPIIATIIHLAISRSREYLADETGAKLMNNSEPLASALLKLEQGSKAKPMDIGNQATAHMFIVNPFSGRSLMKLFSTHPPIESRVRKLRNMQF